MVIFVLLMCNILLKNQQHHIYIVPFKTKKTYPPKNQTFKTKPLSLLTPKILIRRKIIYN
jgi:hypothetical protein